MACPKAPRLPPEVIARFSWMRSFDYALKVFADEICASITQQTTDLSDVYDELASLQSDVAQCCNSSSSTTPSSTVTPVSWDMGHVVGVLGGYVELGDGFPLDEIFDMAA